MLLILLRLKIMQRIHQILRIVFPSGTTTQQPTTSQAPTTSTTSTTSTVSSTTPAPTIIPTSTTTTPSPVTTSAPSTTQIPTVAPKCNGIPSTDWGCCTTLNQCNVGEGDCDDDSECSGSLTCGSNNCKATGMIGSNWDNHADCCIGKIRNFKIISEKL